MLTNDQTKTTRETNATPAELSYAEKKASLDQGLADGRLDPLAYTVLLGLADFGHRIGAADER